jgi:hypothetical protein
MPDQAAARNDADLVLNRYRPLRPLGRGGAGSVWLARDERSGAHVALKIVAREGNAGTRAEREAATAARLRHERCVRAYALARDREHVYIAYEYVAGTTLRDVLREKQLGEAEIVEVGRQLLEGLAHAHRHGVVHRDVKPSNVLLAEGPVLSVRILDFGLALIEEEATLTAVGDVPGTLAYIPPERLRGEAATAAADVWAVGVILWEALAGRHPFWNGTLADTAKAIAAGAEPLQRRRPDLPRALTSLVDRALSLDPKARPSAAKLAAALGRRRGTVRRRRRRGRLGTAAPAVAARLVPAAAAALTAGYAASVLPFYPERAAPVLAVLAATLSYVSPRAGLALALAVPVLPLGNVSAGAAILYAVGAAAWLALFWGAPRDALLFVAGPLLAPLGALVLLPLALERIRGLARRAAAAAVGVFTATLTAGLANLPLPFSSGPPPGGLSFADDSTAGAAAATALDALTAQPAVLRAAAVLAGVAALLPLARRQGTLAAAGLCAAELVCLLLPPAGLAVLPVVAGVWLTFGALTLRAEHVRLLLGARPKPLAALGPDHPS